MVIQVAVVISVSSEVWEALGPSEAAGKVEDSIDAGNRREHRLDSLREPVQFRPLLSRRRVSDVPCTRVRGEAPWTGRAIRPAGSTRGASTPSSTTHHRREGPAAAGLTPPERVPLKLVTTVRTPSRSYPVYSCTDVGQVLSALWKEEWRQAAIIGDDTTAGLFGPALQRALEDRCSQVGLFSFPQGEDHKTRATKGRLEDGLLEKGFDRTCCILAVGGGIALDVGGSVAATYMRGIPHLNVATSLLAQVDASVGGKTGVNTPAGKNLIGSFHQPHAVILDLAALESLPEEEVRNGLAEAVKHGVVADATLFADLAEWAEGGPRALPEELLARCVRVKADLVARDEEESGLRRVLNYGHTVGHALEAATDHRMPHGEAVAAGMAIEARIAERVARFPTEATGRLVRVLECLGLPTRSPVPLAEALPFMKRDKKARDGVIRFALPTDLGVMAEAGGTWAMEVTPEVVGEAWAASD